MVERPKVFVGLHLLVTRQEGVLYLKDTGVLVQEIASVRVSQVKSTWNMETDFNISTARTWALTKLVFRELKPRAAGVVRSRSCSSEVVNRLSVMRFLRDR